MKTSINGATSSALLRLAERRCWEEGAFSQGTASPAGNHLKMVEYEQRLARETSINDATSSALLRLVERRCWEENENFIFSGESLQ